MRLINLIYVLIAIQIIQGCTLLGFYKYDYTAHTKVRDSEAGISIPNGIKKAKSHITPSIKFRDALKNYREDRRAFPSSMWELSNSGEAAVRSIQEMRAAGFDNLDVIFFSPDSTKIWFSHKPVYNQKIGRTKIEGSYITGIFVFTYSDSSFQTMTRYDP